ncbi:hypothetical protein BIT28_25245 [Photobacterium proteolyticum]|uniref:DUF998 domain-containing protein n=1 Tax=Photobacterium proteolyticum TaxID=1903952 RepID=A0A1Q9GFH3_9GAMM|nr:hypothetical protein [Photobacterium proteolyticum]OLQ73135.1 hypothetical protein BIT28_25245 [Photobacterium proteolyticum]
MQLTEIMKFKIVLAPMWVNGFIFIPSTLFVCFLYYLGEPYIYEIMSDPITYFDGEVWTGFGSNIGIFIWASSSAIAIFCGIATLHAREDNTKPKFLILLGLLTLLLSLDDLFLIHDIILPHFGISEYIIYTFYAFSGLYIVFKYLNIISKTENFLFFIGGIMFCMSIFIDVIPSSPLLGFLEDAVKLIGIFAWSGYLIRTSLLFLNDCISPAST